MNMGLCKSCLHIVPIVACSIAALIVSHKNNSHLSLWKLKYKEFQCNKHLWTKEWPKMTTLEHNVLQCSSRFQ